MERRDFLKLAGATGLAVLSSHGKESFADQNYTGPLWIMIHAGGGWDVTSVCDPKGADKLGVDGKPMNKYPSSAIQKAGNIAYAPMDQSPDVNKNMTFTANKDFFEANYQDLTVINGIDNATNSHDAGTRITWAGTLIEGKPTVAALIAAAYLPSAPMGFITFGGYDTTDGVVGAARLGDISAMKRIAYPFAFNPDKLTDGNYQSPMAQQMINDARTARYNALVGQQRLPRVKTAMSQLYTSRLGANELSKLTANLPKDIPNSMLGSAMLAMAAYKSGLCVSANLEHGGWDTHGDSDRNTADAIQGRQVNDNGYVGNDGLLPLVTEMRKRASQVQLDNGMTLDQNMVIVIGSDFGRTNGYNAGNGKDHWSITSMMIMGSINGQKIPGNRVLGLTDDTQSPILIDPTVASLQQASTSGIRITPGHIQKAIRRAAKIDTNPVVAAYPMTEKEDLPIFG